MNFIQFKNIIVLALASLSIGLAQAAELKNENALPHLSIKAVGFSHSPCGNSLANCLVTLTSVTLNEGFVTFVNNSKTTSAYLVTARLPADWNGDAIPTSTCDQVDPQTSCTLRFRAVTDSSQPRRTIEIRGSNTSSAFFDMEIVPQ